MKVVALLLLLAVCAFARVQDKKAREGIVINYPSSMWVGQRFKRSPGAFFFKTLDELDEPEVADSAWVDNQPQKRSPQVRGKPKGYRINLKPSAIYD